MSANNDTIQEHGSQEQPSHNGDSADMGHSGEGAASALAQMISQGRQRRFQPGEPGDAAGSRQ